MTQSVRFIWSKHAQLYENEQEETKNTIVETTIKLTHERSLIHCGKVWHGYLMNI